jgi:hypothetical protein
MESGFHGIPYPFIDLSPLGGLYAASKLLPTSLQLVAGWMVEWIDGCICKKEYFRAALSFTILLTFCHMPMLGDGYKLEM